MRSKKGAYKIAIISTHGTGKTTLCYEVAAQLKKRGFKTKVFSEIATMAYEQGIPINESTTLPAQLYIMLQHMCEELRGTIRNYEVVVCDRSVFDNWIYLERNCGQGKNKFICDFIRSYAEIFKYDALYKLPLVGELMEDGVRDAKNEKFRLDIYNRLNTLLDDVKIPHKTLPAPESRFRREWCDTIVSDVLEKLKPTVQLEAALR